VRRVWLLAVPTIVIALAGAPTASAQRVFTIKAASAPGPAKYDRIRVIEQGPRTAHNVLVLVLVPGTSAGAAYFHPAAAVIAKRLKGWRVWSVDRRENLLEDHSMLDRVLAHKASLRDLFRYYLEWLGDP
jgi:pimeloyl-ACP methyl ester carboxylesterase